MDEVRVYRRALSAAEIATLHDPTATTPPVLPEPSGEEPPPPPPPPPPDEPPGPPPPGTGAQFTLDRDTVPAFGRVRLDASGSVPPGGRAASFLWDLNSDGTPEADCGPETPVLDTPLTRSTTAQLTVVDAFSGARTTSSRALTVAARGRAAQVGALRRSVGRLESLVTRAPLTPTCRPGPGGAGGADTTALGGPPAGCVDSMQAYVALVEAVGCLQTVEDWTDIPLPERRLLVNAVAPGTFLPDESKSALITGRFGARAAGGRARDLAEGREDAARFTALLRGTLLMSDRTVRVNGLDYTPTGRSRLLIVQPGIFAERRTPYVIGSNVEVTAGTDVVPTVKLRSASAMVLPVDRSGMEIGRIPIDVGVPVRAGHPAAGARAGDARARAQPDRPPRCAFPTTSCWEVGQGISAEVQLLASNRDGIRLDGFGIENVDAAIFGVGVHIDYLRYVSSLRHFEGKAGVSIPPLGAIEGTLHVRGDTIELLDITYFPQAPGIKVAPGVFLSEVDGFYESSPSIARFGGGAAFTGGPSAGQGCGLVTSKGSLELRYRPAPVTLTVEGQGSLVCLPLFRAKAVIAADGFVNVAAGIDYSFGPVSLKAGWDVKYRDLKFTAQADADGCVEDLGCARGTALDLRQGAGVLRRVRAGRRRRGPRLAAGPVDPGDHRPARHHVLRLRRRRVADGRGAPRRRRPGRPDGDPRPARRRDRGRRGRAGAGPPGPRPQRPRDRGARERLDPQRARARVPPAGDEDDVRGGR